MSEEDEIHQIRKQQERRGRRGVTDLDALSERLEIQREILELARHRDESGLRELLTERLGIKEGSEKYRLVLSEFWNVVRESEKRPRGRR